MIQTVLSFALGFLVAAALALAAAPAVWRRAGELMRRQIEASVPLSREELEAEIDAIRAEHAMTMRRLEMKAEAIKKKAAQDFVEINLLREQVTALDERCAERDASIAALKLERDDLAAKLAETASESQSLASKLAEAEQKLNQRTTEVEELSRLYEEASFTASSRQIELAAREGDVESLNHSLSLLRSQRKDADRAMREAKAEKVQAENTLAVEQKRVAELERKVERLMTNLSTREERLDRQAKEIARLKQKIKSGSPADSDSSGRIAEIEQEKARLEAQVADLSLQLSTLLAEGGEAVLSGEAPTASKPEVERLRSRLSTIMRENKKLRAELSARAAIVPEPGDEVLRERISNLAAEVVNMAAALEGPGSAIDAALSQPAAASRSEDGQRPLSLADRVRALRQQQDSAAAE